MSETPELAASGAQLTPAYSLIFEGLDGSVRLDDVLGPLAQLMRMSEAQARETLSAPPVLIGQSRDQAALQQHLQRLSQLGCRCRLEDIWRYRHWSLPQLPVALFETLPRRELPVVYALFHIRPVPGVHALQAAVTALDAQGEAWPVNHGQLLVQLTAQADKAGVGQRLLRWQQSLERALTANRSAPERTVHSVFAIRPEDGDSLPQLLDCLERRLFEITEEPDGQVTESPKQILSRPLSGRSWARLIRDGLVPVKGKALDAEQVGQIRRNWPLGHALSTPVDPALPARLERLVEQYQAGSFRRVERCWELIRAFDQWQQMPRMPSHALQALELAQAPEGSTRELTQLVQSDPALSTRILSLVNSSYYGFKQSIDSIAHALVLLGFEEVAQLALLLSSEAVFQGLSRERSHRLWRHSAVTADLARALARRLQREDSAALYTAALLHDVGKVVLYSMYPQTMQDLERIARVNKLPLHEMEREFFGHDHASLGAALMRRWGLPESLCGMVEEHHGPVPGRPAICADAALIGIADHLALRASRTEPWADDMRLRQAHLDALKSELGDDVSLQAIDQLLAKPERHARVASLMSL